MPGKFEEYLLKERKDAYLISNGDQNNKTKEEYILNAEAGLIVAFRLNFESNNGTKLTKVISGKILDNEKENEQFVVETRNGLKYGVPYDAVVWVKTGARWPKGVYEEMKQGATEVEDNENSRFDFGGFDEPKVESDF